MELYQAVKPTILVVDDTPANLILIAGLLKELYTVKAFNRGARALKAASDEPPDLILLDIMMPDLDGYEVCRRLKANPHTHQVPVIFLTSKNQVEDEQLGLEVGAVDYITRPINPPILLSRVRAHFADAAHARTMRVSNEYLEFEVAKRTRQLAALQDVTILALASLAETRDTDTGNHLRRTQHYMRTLGQRLRKHPDFCDFLSAGMIDILYKCAPLHDIGKVGIPDRILLKPGRYEPQEFEIMKTHPTLGRDAIMKAQKTAGEMLGFLEIAKEIVYSHHEKWDGTGYPLGLAGAAIPISARLMALADVYDALISPRIYKAGMTHEQAVQIIVMGRGLHFDPAVVDAFLQSGRDFQLIAARYADTQSDMQIKADYLAQAL
jgi:putative two-component system response regulator